MNSIDIILLLPILFGFARGLWSGLIREVAGIVGVVVGIILGYLFNEQLVEFLISELDMSNEAANITGFGVLFLAGFLAVLAIARVITKGMSLAALGGVNRLLGGLFAALKYAVFTAILLSVFNRINDTINIVEKEKLANSTVYGAYDEFSSILWEYVPEKSEDYDLESIQNRLNPGE